MFDLGGVLIDWNPRHLYRPLFEGDETAMEEFLATVCTPEWNALLDRGLPFAEGVAALQRDYPQHTELIAAYHSRWPEMLGGLVEGTAGVLADLKARGVPVYALSNWSAETFPLAAEQFEVLSQFDGVILSGAERLTKPDPRIFQLLAERFGLTPATTLFIDDAPANVAAARALGFPAVLFESAGQLRAALDSLGLLPAASD